jgi:hypothetical protein
VGEWRLRYGSSRAFLYRPLHGSTLGAMRFKTLLAVVTAVTWMLQAQLALGATVGVFEAEGGQVLIRYEAGLGEINDLIVVEAPEDVYLFTDLNAAITPLAGCTSISPMSARCQVTPELIDTAVILT